MIRTHIQFLQEWLSSPKRKPLVIRGARQVGKTWLVRELARICNKELIEINLEKNLQYISLFSTNDVKQIMLNLSATFNIKIDYQKSLLFLDEVQAAPELLAKLRWFSEDLPELPIICAGSLLEFVLAEHEFSMPVGRIQYMHLEPMSFEEYLLANNQSTLIEFIKSFKIEELNHLSQVLHERYMILFKEYLIIGGLPEAVNSWIAESSIVKIDQIHHDLLATYRDDFAKYKGRIDIQVLDKIMNAIPKLLGKKFKYSKVDLSLKTNIVKQALYLLNKAKITSCVMSSAANGVPLSAQIREKHFKQIFLDIGLVSASLGLNLSHLSNVNEINLINQGAIAEQVTGQILRTINPPYVEPNLYYWQREEIGSNAELDYVIEHGDQIIPIEVKAGSTGSLKSLHLFMGAKDFSVAIRVNSDLPSLGRIDVKDPLGNSINYQLLSIPFYLLSEIHRFIEQMH